MHFFFASRGILLFFDSFSDFNRSWRRLLEFGVNGIVASDSQLLLQVLLKVFHVSSFSLNLSTYINFLHLALLIPWILLSNEIGII